jgi:hypothetical protein
MAMISEMRASPGKWVTYRRDWDFSGNDFSAVLSLNLFHLFCCDFRWLLSAVTGQNQRRSV